MDLTFTAEQQAFRAEVRGWLDASAPTRPFAPYYTEQGLAEHLEWERRLFDAGYAAPGWPKEAGGLGLDLWTQLIWDEEYASLRLPERLNKMGLVHGGPTVLVHGTVEQQRRWLPPILDCSEIWCQGFSEPDAGSDLASLRTTGRVEGDELVINGQKTWTSYGLVASKMFALVRTDPQAARHRGISFVVLDVDADGVEVRPMQQLHGHAGFAEVFFIEARVPLANVVGDLNDGWRVAQTSLKLERGTGRGKHTRLMQAFQALAEEVGRRGVEFGAMERLGSLKAWAFAQEQATYALTDKIARGEDDGVDSSILKVRWSQIHTAIYEEYLATLGVDAEVVADPDPTGALPPLLRDYWHARAAEIFGGSSEIQKNIISERGLGLPRETRP